jgi:hypothetical protein
MGSGVSRPIMRISTNSPSTSLQLTQPTTALQRQGSWDIKRCVSRALDTVFPAEKEFGGIASKAKPTLFRQFVNRMPTWLASQFEARHKERTIKYVTWVAPAIIYPPVTYFATSDKQKEGKDNLLRQYSRYAVGPLIQLGIDGLFLTTLARFKPNAFENRAQAEITSFLAAYLCYTGWETYGVQRTVEQGRKIITQHQTKHQASDTRKPRLNV